MIVHFRRDPGCVESLPHAHAIARVCVSVVFVGFGIACVACVVDVYVCLYPRIALPFVVGTSRADGRSVVWLAVVLVCAAIVIVIAIVATPCTIVVVLHHIHVLQCITIVRVVPINMQVSLCCTFNHTFTCLCGANKRIRWSHCYLHVVIMRYVGNRVNTCWSRPFVIVFVIATFCDSRIEPRQCTCLDVAFVPSFAFVCVVGALVFALVLTRLVVVDWAIVGIYPREP